MDETEIKSSRVIKLATQMYHGNCMFVGRVCGLLRRWPLFHAVTVLFLTLSCCTHSSKLSDKELKTMVTYDLRVESILHVNVEPIRVKFCRVTDVLVQI